MIMQTDHQSQPEIPHHKDVPFETRQSVIEQRSLSEYADVKRLGEQARKANLIIQEHRNQLTNLMGSSKYEQFRAYVAEQKRYQAEVFFPPHGPQMTLEHFSIRLGVARVCEISFAFFFGNPFEKRGDCSPKLLNSARLHFA